MPAAATEFSQSPDELIKRKAMVQETSNMKKMSKCLYQDTENT